MGDTLKQKDLGKTARQSGIFSCGQVAKLLGVAPRTVGKWLDLGYIKGYKIPHGNPLSTDGLARRFSRENIILFCKEFNIPIPRQLIEDKCIVSFGVNTIDERRFIYPRLLNYVGEFEFGCAMYELNLIAVCILGTNRGKDTAKRIFDRIKSLQSKPNLIMCLEPGDTDTNYDCFAAVQLPCDLTPIIKQAHDRYDKPFERIDSYVTKRKQEQQKYVCEQK